MSGEHELAREWLKKADNDLITAQHTLRLKDGPTDTVCFHAQQVVEKGLKALLTYHARSFVKIHNLVLLLDMLTDLYPILDRYREPSALLSAYAVETRYPGDYVEPDRDEAIAAVEVAEDLLKTIRELIPA
jgi:HEPN domain-containing protein